MAEKIRAEEGAIEKGAAAVENARLGIDNRIKDIESKMAELGSFWSGDAANSFNTLMMSWQEKASALNRILNDLRDNLRGTGRKRGRQPIPHVQVAVPAGLKDEKHRQAVRRNNNGELFFRSSRAGGCSFRRYRQ